MRGSARSAIPKAMATKLKSELNGQAPYITNIYNNVITKVTHFDAIQNYPTISITPGPETREDMPSNFTLCYVDLYIRVYVQDQNDAQGQLETIIADIETFVDNNLSLEYTVDAPSGGTTTDTTISNSIVSISTDEGLLDPLALGELILTVQYKKIR